MHSSKASIVNVLAEDKCIIVDNVPCQCDFVLPVGVKAIEWDIDAGGHLIFKNESQYHSVNANDVHKMDEFYDKYVEPYVRLYNKEQDRLRILSDKKNRCHDVNECRRKKKYEILEKYKIAVNDYLKDYTAEEIQLFPQLYEGACIYLIKDIDGSDKPYTNKEMFNVQLLTNIADTRNMKISDLANDIIDEYKKYINVVGQLIGQKQRYLDQLNSLGKDTTIKLINAIDIHYTVIW